MPAPIAPDDAAWPVGVVAARLETTTATLRAWERRYGLAPSARTRGGHRRYSAEDIALLRRMLDLLGQGIAPADAARALRASATPGALGAGAGADDVGAPPAPRSPTVTPGPQQLRDLTDAMHALDAETVTLLVSDVLTDAGAAAAWTGLLAPALIAIGEHWQRTGCGVEVEHLTSGVIEAALRRHAHAAYRTSSTHAPILLAAAPGEGHTLPLAALAAALADHDTRAILLGDLPVEALTDAIRRLSPRAVVLWARTSGTADPACLRHAQAATNAPLHPAGPGWHAGSLPAGTAALLRELPQAVDLLRIR